MAERHVEREQAGDAYTLLVEQAAACSRNGEIPGEAVQNPLEYLAAQGAIARPTPPPSKYIDLSYLRKAGEPV